GKSDCVLGAAVFFIIRFQKTPVGRHSTRNEKTNVGSETAKNGSAKGTSQRRHHEIDFAW
ncbi:MAG: hypothetical protein WKG03_00035, partial [Telluria sp.]